MISSYKITRELYEDYLGMLGFHNCSGPGAAYFEYGLSQHLNDPSPRRFTYEVISIGGVKPEGSSTGLVTTSFERAYIEFMYELGKYVLAHGKRGDTVVWRRLPEITARHYDNEFDGGFEAYWTANCRMVVVPGYVTNRDLEIAFKEMVERNERKESEANQTVDAKDQPGPEGCSVRPGSPESAAIQYGTTESVSGDDSSSY
jgi:hypothetical protein